MKISAFTTCLLISATFFAPGRTGKATSTSHVNASATGRATGLPGEGFAKADAEIHSTIRKACTGPGGLSCTGDNCCVKGKHIKAEVGCLCELNVDDESHTKSCKNNDECKTTITVENCCDDGFQLTDDSTTPETCKCQKTSHVETRQIPDPATPEEQREDKPKGVRSGPPDCLEGDACEGKKITENDGKKYCCEDDSGIIHKHTIGTTCQCLLF